MAHTGARIHSRQMGRGMRFERASIFGRGLLVWVGAVLAGPGLGVSRAAELKPETIRAWDEYVRGVNARMKARLQAGTFLWVDEKPERSRAVRTGAILVAPLSAHEPTGVPNGLIHHWIGAAFVPDARVDDVFSVVRNYGRYKEFYRPVVVDSRALGPVGDKDRFSMTVLNRPLFAKVAMDSDYEGSYFQVDDRRWYNTTYSTRVQEVENYGEHSECRLTEGTGSGYIWRLYSLARFEQRDGGVYVELEAVALSRDIPASLHWLVSPMVRRVSKSSMLTSLEQTRAAVGAAVAAAKRYPTATASTRSAIANFSFSMPKPVALEISK